MPKESIHMKLGINAFCDDKKLPVKGFNSAGFHNDKNGLPKNVISGLLMMYCMGELNMSLADIINISPEKKKDVMSSFVVAISSHPVESNALSGVEMKKNIEWYVSIAKNTNDKLRSGNYKFPENLYDKLDDLNNFNTTETFGVGYVAGNIRAALMFLNDTTRTKIASEINMDHFDRRSAFLEAYGKDRYDEDMMNMRVANSYALHAMDTADENNHPLDRFTRLVAGATFIDKKIGGKEMFKMQQNPENAFIKTQLGKLMLSENNNTVLRNKLTGFAKERKLDVSDKKIAKEMEGGSFIEKASQKDSLFHELLNVVAKSDDFKDNNDIYNGESYIQNELDKRDVRRVDAHYKEAAASPVLNAVITSDDIREIAKITGHNQTACLKTFESIQKDGGKLEFYYSLLDNTARNWEYSDLIFNVPEEVRNSGNLNNVVDYFNKNQRTMEPGLKAQFLTRIKALKHAETQREEAKNGSYYADALKNRPKVKVESDKKASIKVALDRKQSSKNGCWSCSLKMLLKGRGVDVSQEEIRAYRPDYSKKILKDDYFINDANFHLNSDAMNNISERADAGLGFAPDTMVRSFEVSTPKVASSYIEIGKDIDNAAYIKAATEAIRKKIFKIITDDKSPVAFTDQNHYWTIRAIDGDEIECIDSTAPVDRQIKRKKIEDVVKKLFDNKVPFKLVWMADIELKEDGKSFYNVPSDYLGLNEDGTIKLPPKAVHEFSNQNRTKLESDGFVVSFLGGKERSNYEMIGVNPLNKDGILVTEEAYFPDHVNAEHLREVAAKRSVEETKYLKDKDKELFGASKIAEDDKEVRIIKDAESGKKSSPLFENLNDSLPNDDSKKISREDEKARDIDIFKNLLYFNDSKKVKNRALIREFNEANRIGIKIERDENGKEQLYDKTGGVVMFRIHMAYEKLRKFYTAAIKMKVEGDKYEKILDKLEKSYEDFIKSMDRPDNQIEENVNKPDIYPYNFYPKTEEDMRLAINFLGDIDAISLKDFGSFRYKDQHYNQNPYSPTVMALCAENIKSFMYQYSEGNVFKNCVKNKEYHEALNDLLTLPTDDVRNLNEKIEDHGYVSWIEYYVFSGFANESFLTGNTEEMMKAYGRFKNSLLDANEVNIFPNIRNNHMPNVKQEEERAAESGEQEKGNEAAVNAESVAAGENAAEDLDNHSDEYPYIYYKGSLKVENIFEDLAAAKNTMSFAGYSPSNKNLMAQYAIYCYAELNMTPSEITNMTPEQHKEAASKFLSDVRAHVFAGDEAGKLSADELESNIIWWAQLQRKAHDKFNSSELVYPDVELLTDPVRLQEFYNSDQHFYSLFLNEMYTLDKALESRSVDQTQENPYGVNRYKAFQKGYGRAGDARGAYNLFTRNMRIMEGVNNLILKTADENRSIEDRICAKTYLEGDLLKKLEGKKISEANKIIPCIKGKKYGVEQSLGQLAGLENIISNESKEVLDKEFTEAEMTMLLSKPFYQIASENPACAGRFMLNTAGVYANLEFLQELNDSIASSEKDENAKESLITEHFRAEYESKKEILKEREKVLNIAEADMITDEITVNVSVPTEHAASEIPVEEVNVTVSTSETEEEIPAEPLDQEKALFIASMKANGWTKPEHESLFKDFVDVNRQLELYNIYNQKNSALMLMQEVHYDDNVSMMDNNIKLISVFSKNIKKAQDDPYTKSNEELAGALNKLQSCVKSFSDELTAHRAELANINAVVEVQKAAEKAKVQEVSNETEVKTKEVKAATNDEVNTEEVKAATNEEVKTEEVEANSNEEVKTEEAETDSNEEVKAEEAETDSNEEVDTEKVDDDLENLYEEEDEYDPNLRNGLQQNSDSAETYEDRVYNDLVQLTRKGDYKEVVNWLADIAYFIELDDKNDDMHRAAENILDRYKDFLYGKSLAAKYRNEVEFKDIVNICKEIAKFNAESYLQNCEDKENLEWYLGIGLIEGAEALHDDDAKRDIADAIVEATYYNSLRLRAFTKRFYKPMMSDMDDIYYNKEYMESSETLSDVLSKKVITKTENEIKSRGVRKYIEKNGSNPKRAWARYERGQNADIDIEKYGYKINPNALKGDEKLFSKMPEAVEYVKNHNVEEIGVKSAEAVDDLTALNNFKSIIEKISDYAKGELKELDSVSKKKKDSVTYTSMRNLLEKVSKFDTKCTPSEVIGTLNDLSAAAGNYEQTHSHWWKAKKRVGIHRIERASVIGAWARFAAEKLDVDKKLQNVAERGLEKEDLYETIADRTGKKNVYEHITNQRKNIDMDELLRNRAREKKCFDFHKKRVEIRNAKGEAMKLSTEKKNKGVIKPEEKLMNK
ncbi:hypothetical protein SAMN05216390_10977 [Lachnospiraceae bacterium KH1T2]|nr:hypothetical protein SAMN05216390_10977 [Lachnospiraceae bacterium KH1T2]